MDEKLEVTTCKILDYCFVIEIKQDYPDKIALLYSEEFGEEPICTGFYLKGYWYYEIFNEVRENPDLYQALIQLLCNEI